MNPVFLDGIAHYGKDKPYPGREDNLQKSCANYLRSLKEKPLFTHPANGGYRTPAEAGLFKAMGQLPGVCDLLIFEPSMGWHGLFIELKVKGGKLTEHQKRFIEKANDREYMAVVCWNFDSFKAVVDEYMAEI